jgi:hypothetical protein
MHTSEHMHGQGELECSSECLRHAYSFKLLICNQDAMVPHFTLPEAFRFRANSGLGFLRPKRPQYANGALRPAP